MRLGLIIYGGLETVSGGYLYDRKLVEYLKRQGNTVEILALPWRNYASHLCDNLSPRLLRSLHQAPVDLLLQDELNHPSLFWLNQRLRNYIRYPLITIVHHLRSSEHRPTWQNKLYALVERRYLQGVDAFIFNSQTTLQAVEQAGVDLGARPHLVAYPAGDRLSPHITEDEIIQRGQQSGPLRLLFLGNLIPRKGLHTLLDALKRLPSESWRLTVVGSLLMDKAYTRSILRQISRDSLGARVHLRGVLDNEDLADEMQSNQLLVVPSSYEGFGIVYLEGMGFGLPAVGTTAGAAGEIITQGQDGFLIPPEDDRMLAEVLSRLAQDRQRLIDLGVAARRRYLEHPTWEQTCHRIYEFMVELIG